MKIKLYNLLVKKYIYINKRVENMKFKQIVLITLLLLTVFTISTVSAADNLTDSNDGTSLEYSIEEINLYDGEEDEIPTPKAGTYSALYFDLDENLKDKYYAYNKKYDNNFFEEYDLSEGELPNDGIHYEHLSSITIDGKGITIDGKNLARGLYFESCNKVIIKNIKFVNCYNKEFGGAIYLSENCKYCQIVNCTFVNCHAFDGGAICGNIKKFTISNCKFENCYAQGGMGGAIFSLGDLKDSISKCRFVNCHAGTDYSKNRGMILSPQAKISGCKFIVNAIPTKLISSAKTFKVKTKTKKYATTLKTNKNKAIKNVKLTLKVKGKTYSAKTNNKGKAIFEITKLTKKGKYNAIVKFIGDTKYKATSKKVKITVK